MDNFETQSIGVNKKVGWWLVFVLFFIGLVPPIVLTVMYSEYSRYAFHPFLEGFLFSSFASWPDIALILSVLVVLTVLFKILKHIKYLKNFSKLFIFVGVLLPTFIFGPIQIGLYNWMTGFGGIDPLPPFVNIVLIITAYTPLIVSLIFVVYSLFKFKNNNYKHIYGYSISLGILSTILINILYSYIEMINIIWCFLGASCFKMF